MITTPTVLILGAGASQPYGFPTGRELIFKIGDGLRHERTQFTDDIRSCRDFHWETIEQFRNQLLYSNDPSVDTFLEKRPEYVELGKLAIARALIPCEDEKMLLRKPDRFEWYELLFKYLTTSKKEDFAKNQLSVITFNYDRSLEYSLFFALRNAYGIDENEAATLVQCIPFIHVYGQLGQPHFVSKKGRKFEVDAHQTALKICMNELTVLHEQSNESPIFNEVRRKLLDAKRIFVLGFAYHPTNLQRISIKPLLQNAPFKPSVFGTVKGLGSAQIDQARIELANSLTIDEKIHLGTAYQDVVTYLTEDAILN